MRFASILAVFVSLAAARSAPAQGQPAGPFDGTWEISALIDDGEVIPASIIKMTIASDGRLAIRGQAITVVRPNGNKKTLLFTTDPQASPPAFDLAGSDKTGGKGIYLSSGDTLMICLSGPEVGVRPTSFTSKAGSQTMLMTLTRVKEPLAPAPGAPGAVPVPLPPAPVAAVSKDDEIRKILIGTWGHQDNDKIERGTFNTDGSFSMTRTWKKAYKRFFDDDERFSGEWRLDNGRLVIRITAATDPKARGQVFTYRINSISETEMLLVDDTGHVRREWKTR